MEVGSVRSGNARLTRRQFSGPALRPLTMFGVAGADASATLFNSAAAAATRRRRWLRSARRRPP